MLSGRVERPRVRRTSEYRVSDHSSAIAIERALRYAVSPAPPWYILGYRAIEQDSAKGIVPQPSGPPSGARALFAGLCHDRGCVGVERRDLTLFPVCHARQRLRRMIMVSAYASTSGRYPHQLAGTICQL